MLMLLISIYINHKKGRTSVRPSITQTSLQATGYQLCDDEVTNFSATPLPRCHPDGEIASEYQLHTPPLLLDDKATL